MAKKGWKEAAHVPMPSWPEFRDNFLEWIARRRLKALELELPEVEDLEDIPDEVKQEIDNNLK
jgi:hypothetical protein